jgi:hypothetical protein
MGVWYFFISCKQREALTVSVLDYLFWTDVCIMTVNNLGRQRECHPPEQRASYSLV